MQPPARITSIEALNDFKASLIVYLEKAGRILDDVSDDVVRTRVWLETDRNLHWKRQVHLREKELARAEQELLTARLSDMPEAIKARRMAVNKAKSLLAEAEHRLARVRQWLLQYETQVESRMKTVVQLRHLLVYGMGKAVAHLQASSTILAEYAGSLPPRPVPSSAPAEAPVETRETGATAGPSATEEKSR